MAFCQKCGAKLEDGTKFCEICGAEQEVSEAAAPAQAAPAAEKKPAKLDNKMVGLIAMGVIAVVAIVLICVIGSALFGGGYKKPLKTIKKAFNAQSTDVEDYIDALPKFVGAAYDDGMDLVKSIDKKSEKEIKSFIEDALKDFYGDTKDSLGKNVKLSYEITDKEKLDKDDREEIEEAYASIIDIIEKEIDVDITDKKELEELVEDYEDYIEDYFDISSKQIDKAIKLVTNLAGDIEDVKVSKGYILELELTVEGKKDDMSMDIDVYVVKMNGKWCIEPLSTAADFFKEDIEDVIDELLDEIF